MLHRADLEDMPLCLVRTHPWYPRLLAGSVRLPPHDDQEVGCLWWCGARSVGGQRSHERKAEYGSINLGAAEGRRVVRCHVAVATAWGMIVDYRVPLGMNLDHVCDRSLCVEHTHIELVTTCQNQLRRHNGLSRPLTDDEIELIGLRGMDMTRAPWWWPDRLRSWVL